MNDKELKIAVLEGEVALNADEISALSTEIQWWAKEMDFWRRKYLKDHPEHDNWEYVLNARVNEEGE